MDAGTPPPDAENPEKGPGLGSAPPPVDGRKDVQLLAMALECRWPMAAETRATAVKRLERVVMDPTSKERAFYRAIRALASLDRVSLESVATAIRAKLAEGPATEDTLIELALRLRDRDRQKGGPP